MKRVLFAAFTLLLLARTSSAQTNCESLPKSYQDILICAESQSPEIQQAQLELAKTQAQVRAASQLQNPEFAVETFHGKSGNDYQSETDFALAFPVELGGKIAARKAVAEGGVAVAEARLLEARAKVRGQVFLKLHRLRQVLHEQEILDEAIDTFSKLVSQYSKRPGLSPEQQVSFAVFQLSMSEYDLKRSTTLEEVTALDAFFRLTTGKGVTEVRKVVPASPKTWPSLKGDNPLPRSPRLKVLDAELKSANAELSLAQKEVWPTLMIGPSLKLVTESGQANQLLGVNVSLPLPIFSTNAGGRATAAASVRATETRMRNGRRELEVGREELVKTYDESVKALSRSLSHSEIERRHSAAEKLFTKGVVPSSLVIEAHRSSFELERSRHERELKALEALLSIHAIDGTILEINL